MICQFNATANIKSAVSFVIVDDNIFIYDYSEEILKRLPFSQRAYYDVFEEDTSESQLHIQFVFLFPFPIVSPRGHF